MNYYLSVLKNYVGFSGRARRAEFWQFMLVNLVIEIVLEIIDAAVKSSILGLIYGLALLLPTIAVAIRRLHDTNRSGWWVLLWLVFILGWIPLIIFWAQDSAPGANAHGENPKGVADVPAGAPYVA